MRARTTFEIRQRLRTPIRSAAVFVAFAFCIGNAHAGNLSVSALRAPSVLATTDARVLVYELNVRNADAGACARLIEVHASGGTGEALIDQRYQGQALAANAMAYTKDMAKVRAAQSERGIATVDIPAGGGAAVFFFVKLGELKPAPSVLKHTLTFSACSATDARESLTYDLRVMDEAPVMIGLPFRGAGWVVGDSVNATGTHRRTLIPLRDAEGKPRTGQFHVPERYAIDWIMVDANARRANGPIDRNDSYLAYGKEIIAVADGTIARTRDGSAEQTPPNGPPNPTVEMAAGNYLMQDIGGGHFAFYAHLKPGSLRVAKGDRVKRGQVLALLGNSGNSTEPHLHFHVSDAPDPLISEGVPFVFDRFEQTGQVAGMNETSGVFDDDLHYAPIERAARMPASFSVLSVPSAASNPSLPAQGISAPARAAESRSAQR